MRTFADSAMLLSRAQVCGDRTLMPCTDLQVTIAISSAEMSFCSSFMCITQHVGIRNVVCYCHRWLQVLVVDVLSKCSIPIVAACGIRNSADLACGTAIFLNAKSNKNLQDWASC
jgi:hypothetical protein